MDDRTIARTQARMIRTAITGAGLGVRELWREYRRLGGEVDELEVDAYLHHALHLVPRHRDSLARTTNRMVPDARVPCSRDLRPIDGMSEA